MLWSSKSSFSKVVGLEVSFLNSCGSQRVVSQWLWILKTLTILELKECFPMVIELKELFLNGRGAWRVVSQWLCSLESHFSTVMSVWWPVKFGDSQPPIKCERSFFLLCLWSTYALKSFFFCKHNWTCNIVTYAFMLWLCYQVTFFFHHANDQIGQDSFRGLSHVWSVATIVVLERDYREWCGWRG